MTLTVPLLSTGVATSPNGTFLIDHIDEQIAHRFVSESSTAIAAIDLMMGAGSGSPGDITITLETAGSDGLPDGVALATVTATPNASTGLQRFTFSSSHTPSVGDVLYIVVAAATGTWDGSNRIRLGRTGANDAVGLPLLHGTDAGHTSYFSTNAGASYTEQSTHLSLGLVDSGGDYIPSTVFSLISAYTRDEFNTTDAIYERGCKFVTPIACTVRGLFLAQTLDAGGDFEIRIYKNAPLVTDTTPDLTQAYDIDALSNSHASIGNGGYLPFSTPLAVSAGDTVRTTLRATTATDAGLVGIAWGTAASRQFSAAYNSVEGCERAAGNWTDQTAKIWLAFPVFDIDTQPGGGGGGGAPVLVSGGLARQP